MKEKILVVSICLLLAFLVSSTATASVIKLDVDTIIARAQLAFSGKVINIESRPVETNGKMIPFTFVTVSVDETLKGTIAGDTITLKLKGGKMPNENVVMNVSDMPKFEVGEEVLLFVRSNRSSGFPIVGMFQGRFNLVTDKETGIKKVYNNFGRPVGADLLDKTVKSGKTLDYAAFKTYIKKKAE